MRDLITVDEGFCTKYCQQRATTIVLVAIKDGPRFQPSTIARVAAQPHSARLWPEPSHNILREEHGAGNVEVHSSLNLLDFRV